MLDKVLLDKDDVKWNAENEYWWNVIKSSNPYDLRKRTSVSAVNLICDYLYL